MASSINLLRNLYRQVVRSASRPCISVPIVLATACAADDTHLNSNCPKPWKLLDAREMTHGALIRQACTLTVNSSSQLLTQVLVAINDSSEEYRKAMSELMVLLEESILLISNSTSSSLNEVEDLIVEKRNLVEEQRKVVQELVSLMDYVDKMVTSTAETAYLAGAEQCSTLLCERLNSTLTKVVEESSANKKSEEELLKLQETYVLKLGELYEREWKTRENNGPEETAEDEVIKNQVTPIDIFESSSTKEELDQNENGSKLLS